MFSSVNIEKLEELEKRLNLRGSIVYFLLDYIRTSKIKTEEEILSESNSTFFHNNYKHFLTYIEKGLYPMLRNLPLNNHTNFYDFEGLGLKLDPRINAKDAMAYIFKPNTLFGGGCTVLSCICNFASSFKHISDIEYDKYLRIIDVLVERREDPYVLNDKKQTVFEQLRYGNNNKLINYVDAKYKSVNPKRELLYEITSLNGDSISLIGEF